MAAAEHSQAAQGGSENECFFHSQGIRNSFSAFLIRRRIPDLTIAFSGFQVPEGNRVICICIKTHAG
jgi:hypothetical protein